MIQNQTARYLPDIGLKNHYRPQQRLEFRVGICKTCAEDWGYWNPICLECANFYEGIHVREEKQ